MDRIGVPMIGAALAALFGLPAPAATLDLCLQGLAAREAGKPKLAVDLYGRCIADGGLTKNNLGAAHNNRGVTLFYPGRFGDAVADFERVAAIDPRVAYWPIWLYLAEAREDGIADARENLARRARKVDLKAWPAPVVRYLMGAQPVGEMYAGVDGTTPDRARRQKFATDFYFGQAMATAKSRSVADRLLEQAARNCPPLSVERLAARVERARLAK